MDLYIYIYIWAPRDPDPPRENKILAHKAFEAQCPVKQHEKLKNSFLLRENEVFLDACICECRLPVISIVENHSFTEGK